MKKNLSFKAVTLIVPLLFLSLWGYAQNITVSGTVTDETNAALPGASVLVKGTMNGVITNIEGKYSLQVKKGDILVFSFIGYTTKEIPVNNQTEINAKMLTDAQELEDVVVIGYGTQKKEAVTGSVASVRGDEMAEVPSSNITEALQGRISGVEMSRTSTKPGSTMQIRIRGTRSLNADNDPLVVLDGVPFAGSIADISPSDIKSIDILKDASATAIYGSRGANGVILISTFKGRKGQKAKVTLNSYVGLKTLFARYPMMNASEYTKMRNLAGKYTVLGADESEDVDTDFQDLLFKNSMVTSHDLGISGGTEKGNYNFGIGYYRDEALVPLQNYSRYSLRASLDQMVGEYFKFGFSTNSNYSITNGSSISLYNTLSASPLCEPYNEDGSLKRTITMAEDTQYLYTRKGLEDLDDAYVDKKLAFGSYNTVYGEIKIPGVKGLKYRLNLGLNYRSTNNGKYVGEGVFSESATNVSNANISNSLTTNWTIENLLTYDRIFAEKHSLNVVALYSAERTHYHSSYVSATDIPADQFQFYNLGRATGEITVDPSKQGYYESGLMSAMGRIMYSYDNRYMLSVAFRTDGSSRLASGHKWHAYPAVSAGWNIKDEAFMQGLTKLNRLKLRVGYGETSNQSVDPYKTLGLLGSKPYNYGDTYTVGYNVEELPNDELGWEYSQTYNFGLDFTAFNNRLSGTFEYYSQKTKDILLEVELPETSGVDSYYANIGKSENKGFEFSLNGVILDNYNGWTWEAGINIYANRNKLTALASGQQQDEGNCWFVGHPIDVIYDYKKIGLWNETDDDYKYIHTLEADDYEAGMIKVEYTGDYNEDGSPTRQISTADRQVLDLEPDFQGGFNTRIAYKGFDLSVIGAFKRKGILISTLYSSNGYLNMLTGRRNNVDLDYWTEDNTDAKYPKPYTEMPDYGTTMGYFDASYLKIRTITLGYNFDRHDWIKDAGIDKLRLYFTVQNPFVIFSPYKRESGMDPETNSYGDENQAVTSTFQERLLVIGTNSPSTRNYLIGLNLTF